MAVPNRLKQYTLGRGKIYIAPFKDGTKNPDGFRYIGNTPTVSITATPTDLVHFDSDHGIKQPDETILLQLERAISFESDNINYANLAMMMIGTPSEITTSAATVSAEHIDAVHVDRYYQLGATPDLPQGIRGIDFITSGVLATVTNDAGTPVSYDEGPDFTVNQATGQIYVVDGGAITEGTNLRVTYKTLAQTTTQVVSGEEEFEGALQYVEDNPTGENIIHLFPFVRISPDGEYALKGDTWQSIKFKGGVLIADDNTAAWYMNGAPYASA